MMLPDVTDIPDDEGHWLAGITDGEGYFRLGTRKRRLDRYPDRLYHSIEFIYGMTLRADDAPVLHRIQRILKVGYVGFYRPRGVMHHPLSGEAYPANPRFSFRTAKRLDAGRVIATFQRFPLRSKKLRDFELWSKAWHLYHDHMSHTQRRIFQHGILSVPSFKKRRPLRSEPIRRFYSIPDRVWLELDQIADAIKAGRKYVESSARL